VRGAGCVAASKLVAAATAVVSGQTRRQRQAVYRWDRRGIVAGEAVDGAGGGAVRDGFVASHTRGAAPTVANRSVWVVLPGWRDAPRQIAARAVAVLSEHVVAVHELVDAAIGQVVASALVSADIRAISATGLGAGLHHRTAWTAGAIDREAVEGPADLRRMGGIRLSELPEQTGGRHVAVIGGRAGRRAVAAALVKGVALCIGRARRPPCHRAVIGPAIRREEHRRVEKHADGPALGGEIDVRTLDGRGCRQSAEGRAGRQGVCRGLLHGDIRVRVVVRMVRAMVRHDRARAAGDRLCVRVVAPSLRAGFR